VARLADSAVWSVTLHEPWEVPIAEHDAWLDHGLATDIGAAALFNRVLVNFRRKGDGKAVKRVLAEAFEGNRHVPDLLLGRVELPDELSAGYQLGSVEEAVYYFLQAEEAWHQTPGAPQWLADGVDAN
jgi:hypothetical protein